MCALPPRTGSWTMTEGEILGWLIAGFAFGYWYSLVMNGANPYEDDDGDF